MKKNPILFAITLICAAIFAVDMASAVVALVNTGDFVSSFLTNPDALVVLATGIAPSYVDSVGWTPDRQEKWSKVYHVQHENYMIFNSTYTGTNWSMRGPEKNKLVVGAPILVDSELVGGGYNKRTEMDAPLFEDSESRLGAGRLRTQVRTGNENKGSKKFLNTPLALWFDAVYDEDTEMANQEMATGKLVKRLTDLLSRHTAQYKDDEHLIALNAGYPGHVYRTIAAAQDLADNAVVVADTGMGVAKAATEHPNQFVFETTASIQKLTEIDFSTTQATHNLNIMNALNKITTADKPGMKLLNQIMIYVQKKKFAGIRIVGEKSNGYSYFILLVSPRFIGYLLEDEKFSLRMDAAFNSYGKDHPLLRPGDIFYQNLIIRSEEKLLDPLWGASRSFNAAGLNDTDTDGEGPDIDTDATIGSVTDSIYDVTGSRGDADHDVKIVWGTRTIGTNFQATNLAYLEKFYVLGANSMVYVPGNPYNIGPRDTNDYKRITAMGCTHIFGIRRTDWNNVAGTSVLNQSSAVGYCFVGA